MMLVCNVNYSMPQLYENLYCYRYELFQWGIVSYLKSRYTEHSVLLILGPISLAYKYSLFFHTPNSDWSKH